MVLSSNKHPLELAWEALATSAERKDNAIMQLTAERNEARAEVERLQAHIRLAKRDLKESPSDELRIQNAMRHLNNAFVDSLGSSKDG